MKNEVFNRLAKQETDRMLDVMCKKSSDYANDDDKLFNFKQAGKMDNISPIEALRGMWLKHRASIQQGLDELLAGKEPRSRDWWIEKLTDDRNYNLLLFAQLEETYFLRDGTSPGYEGNKPGEFEEFTIKKAQDPAKGWYAMLTEHINYSYQDCNAKFLHKDDLTLFVTTGWNSSYRYGEAPGYYKTKDEACDTIRAYKNKPVFEINLYHPCWHLIGAWAIWDKVSNKYLHKNFQLHGGTGYDRVKHSGLLTNAPGYYPTREIAEAYLKAYKEKNKSA